MSEIVTKISRIEKLESLRTDPWYSKVLDKVKPDSWQILSKYIDDMGDCPANEFFANGHRTFIQLDISRQQFCLLDEIVSVIQKG